MFLSEMREAMALLRELVEIARDIRDRLNAKKAGV